MLKNEKTDIKNFITKMKSTDTLTVMTKAGEEFIICLRAAKSGQAEILLIASKGTKIMKEHGEEK